MVCRIIATLDDHLTFPSSMGHSNSMSPAKSNSGGGLPTKSPQHASSAGSGLSALEKHVHHDNPVEPVRVKLQDPVGYSSDTLWSSEGLKTRSSLLLSASQALSERPASFTLRAPRLQSEVDSRAVHSTQTTPPSDSDGGEEAVDNQKEDEEQNNVLSEKARELPVSWMVASRTRMSKVDYPTDNQGMESSGLSFNLLQDRDNAASNGSHSVDIWANPHSGFEDSDLTSTGSSNTSPVNQNFPSMSASTARSNSERISFSDGKAAGCRVPPGMSLFDRIQEDFPRTPSPEFGHFGDESLPTRRPLFCEKENYTRSMHGINKGMGHLKIGNYHSAPPYGSAYDSHYNLNDMSRMAQYTTSYSPSSINCHRHPFGRSSSEPVFGGSVQGVMAQGYPSPNESSAHGIYGYPMAGKGRWAAIENTYSFPSSPFGITPSEYASLHPSVAPSYLVSYTGDYCGMKPVDKMFKARSSYFVADQTLFSHNFRGYDPRSQMPHRPNAGAFQRDELEFFHPIAHSYSSNTLLEEFNSAPKSEKWGLSVIKGHLFIFAKDQTGSRFIQQKLEKADERAKADAFSEIFPNSLLLMTDVFGNYVIQKFLEYGCLEQQQLLVELMTNNMISLALQVYGCRVIQRALEVTHVEEQLALIRQLKGHVMKCAVDQNGNHVLQKCIEAASWKRAAICNGLVPHRFVKGEDIQFIIDSFVGQAACLSTHSYGCRVIQRVLEHCAPDQIRPLLDEIIYKCRDLVKDQFGNYVVQHVISHGEQNQRDIVMQAVLPEIARWSQHKYASNVVESCLDHATKEEISQIVDFILQYDESGASCALLPMMKHMYGNYVVQKLLDRVDDHDRRRIVCIIRHNEDYLKRFTFGKHVLSRLEREEQVNNFY